MSRSAGTYTLPSNSVSPAVADTVISPTDFNTVMDDIETAVNESTYTAGLGATDNRLVRTDGTDTKKIQGSGVTVDDSANMSGVAALSTTTIELGHASDTTISRTGAGAIAVEGVEVALNSASLTHIASTIELGHATDTTISRTGAGAIAVEGVGVALNSISLAHTAGTIELGHATDTTIARSGAGDITIEGNAVYRAGGTDVALADGGTGASLADPNADRIMFWDDSAGQTTWLEVGSGLSITGTTLASTGGSGDVVGPGSSTDNAIVRFDGTTGKLVQDSSITIGDNGSFTAATGTITASTPWTFSQTWNNAAVTFAGMLIDITNTASVSTSKPFDVQVGGSTVMSVDRAGLAAIATQLTVSAMVLSSTGMTFPNSRDVTFNGTAAGRVVWNNDTFLSRSAAATLQMGAADAATPVAQTLRAQGSRGGTDSNVGGGNLTIQSGTGTGTGTASSLILRSPVVAASGTTAQTQTTGLTITSGIPYVPSYTVAGAPSAATAAGIIYVSDESGGAVLAFSDGTNWRRVTDRAVIS